MGRAIARGTTHTRMRFLNVNAAIRGLILLGLVLAAIGGGMFFTLNAHATTGTTCTWGASSITAYVDAQGVYHESQPVTTGCDAP